MCFAHAQQQQSLLSSFPILQLRELAHNNPQYHILVAGQMEEWFESPGARSVVFEVVNPSRERVEGDIIVLNQCL
jgi:hypothetical protein